MGAPQKLCDIRAISPKTPLREFREAREIVTNIGSGVTGEQIHARATRRSCVLRIPLQEGLKVKYAKVAAVTAGTLMVVGAAAPAFADAHAKGGAKRSPGVISGNVIQVPVHIPVNVCGNTASFIGILNPAFGNRCVNV